jgi:hypothetical protein
MPDDALPPATVKAALASDGSLHVSLPGAERSGICEVAMARKDGKQEVRRYAFNVEAEEGDLKTLAGSELAERLAGVEYEYQQAAAFEHAAEQLAGYDVSEPLLYLLALLLVGEQILAWSASYHPTRRPSAKGGAR